MAHISPVQFGAVSLTEIFELTRELISDSHHGVDWRRAKVHSNNPHTSRRVLSCFLGVLCVRVCVRGCV